MNKNGVMFGALGLIVGLVIGFVGANSINRSAAGQPAAAAPAMNAANGATGQGLPADHPPIGTSSGADAEGPQGAAAIQQVSQAIEKAKQSPNDYEAQMTAADLYYQIQRFEEAAKFYEAAAKIKPSELEPMVKAGNAYFDGEKFSEAEAWYVKALEKDPKNINVRTDLGLTFFLREPRDFDRAIKEYKASLAIDPNHKITLQNLAAAYREKGDTQNYEETAAKLKTLDPSNPIFNEK